LATYDLYEVESTSIGEARRLIENLLSVALDEHESSYHRGPFFTSGVKGEENFELKLNIDPFEDEPNEDACPMSAILLYVNNTTRAGELGSALARGGGAVKLRRHEEI
jgi:hypothetical protein